MKDDERRAKEQERAQKELEKQRQAQIKAQNKAELSKFSLTFLKNLVSGYKERAQKIRKEKEEEKRKALEERLRLKEEKIKQESLAKQKEIEEKKQEEKKAGLFEHLFRKKEHEREEIKEELKEEEPILEEKPTILGRLFGKREAQEPISEKIEAVPEEVEEKPKKSKPASEAEELEEAIKSLGLFKEMEKGKFEISKKKPGIFERLLKKEEKSTPIKEEKISPEKKFFEKEVVKAKEKVKEEKPKIKLTGKSKAFGKCYKALHEAKESISKGNAAKAKKLYLEVRNLYMSMEYHEKKEVYGELMDLYNSLK